MTTRVLIPLAEGCEELEAVTLIDLLRRAEIEVTTAYLSEPTVHCSRGTRLLADVSLDDVMDDEFDLMVLPGGLPGADHLNNDPRIHQLIQRLLEDGKHISAICAAPRVLVSNPAIHNRTITAFPGALDALDLDSFELTANKVEVDGKIITSKGPGTAMDLALTLIEQLEGKETRDRVEAPLQRD